jgi:entericidin B
MLSACNTISGAGQDIEAGGEKIQETAENVKNKM